MNVEIELSDAAQEFIKELKANEAVTTDVFRRMNADPAINVESLNIAYMHLRTAYLWAVQSILERSPMHLAPPQDQ